MPNGRPTRSRRLHIHDEPQGQVRETCPTAGAAHHPPAPGEIPAGIVGYR